VLLLRGKRAPKSLARGCEYDNVTSVGEPSLGARGLTYVALVKRGPEAGVDSQIRTWRSGSTTTDVWQEPDSELVSLARDRQLLAVRRGVRDYRFTFDLARLTR
jgi:hypothetical protein